jgi:hypothetical protein
MWSTQKHLPHPPTKKRALTWLSFEKLGEREGGGREKKDLQKVQHEMKRVRIGSTPNSLPFPFPFPYPIHLTILQRQNAAVFGQSQICLHITHSIVNLMKFLQFCWKMSKVVVYFYEGF